MKKKRRKLGHRRPREGRFELVQDPISNIDRAALRVALESIADRRRAEFPKLIEALCQIFKAKFPPHILAVIGGYSSLAGVSDSGVGNSLLSKIQQHHVELLQALILQIPLADWGREAARPEDIQRVIDTVVDLGEAFHQRRYTAITSETDLQARTVLTLQERLRLHTQAVRNWGYYSQVVAISNELYRPLDERLCQIFGFGASELLLTADRIVSLAERRSNARFKKLRRVFREWKIPKIVRTYYKTFPEIGGDPEAFIRNLPKGTSREQVLALLLSHADIGFLNAFNFTPADVYSESGLSKGVTEQVLDALALTPGSLRNENPEFLFMANPIWRAPFVSTGSEYFCPLPQSVFSHVHTIMRALLARAQLDGLLQEVRSQFLEQKVAALLAAALPRAVLRNGIKWRTGDAVFQTDHLAAIDRTIVIVEDKSAALTARGLRGAPERVRRHIQELVVDPSIQSARLKAIIQRAAHGDGDAIQILMPFEIDFSKVERIVRISVTLDDFSVLSSAERDLRQAGWITDETELAPTVNLADFDTSIQILDGPAFFLHYFAERERVQKAVDIFADEMDFLGCYLLTGFNLGSLETEGYLINLTGMSAAIDSYYNCLDAGVKLRKPMPKTSPYFARLISSIVDRAFPRWSTVTTDLLRCASYEEQLKIDRLLERLKSNVERNWRVPGHECSLIVSPPAVRDTAIVFYAYPQQHVTKRKEIAQQLALQALETSKRSRCIVVSRNISRWNEPYASIAIFNETDAHDEENVSSAHGFIE